MDRKIQNVVSESGTYSIRSAIPPNLGLEGDTEARNFDYFALQILMEKIRTHGHTHDISSMAEGY